MMDMETRKFIVTNNEYRNGFIAIYVIQLK